MSCLACAQPSTTPSATPVRSSRTRSSFGRTAITRPPRPVEMAQALMAHRASPPPARPTTRSSAGILVAAYRNADGDAGDAEIDAAIHRADTIPRVLRRIRRRCSGHRVRYCRQRHRGRDRQGGARRGPLPGAHAHRPGSPPHREQPREPLLQSGACSRCSSSRRTSSPRRWGRARAAEEPRRARLRRPEQLCNEADCKFDPAVPPVKAEPRLAVLG